MFKDISEVITCEEAYRRNFLEFDAYNALSERSQRLIRKMDFFHYDFDYKKSTKGHLIFTLLKNVSIIGEEEYETYTFKSWQEVSDFVEPIREEFFYNLA